LSHIRPDGDCLGSQIALCRWLQLRGFTTTAFNDDDIPENLEWLQNQVTIEKPDEKKLSACDLFILVDGNAIHRFGSFEEWYKGKKQSVWVIDHHPDPDSIFEVIVSETTVSSTCEMIYELYEQHDLSYIDSEIAKALYTGIITDTGSLQFESVTPRTVEITADLLRKGQFKPNEVIERIYSNKSLEQMKLLSGALDTIQLFKNNQIAVMYVTEEMVTKSGADFSDCDGFVNYPLSISGVKAAILMKDKGNDGIRMSLRSRSELDVNVWARNFSGGGHKKAAGAWHPGPLDLAIKEVTAIGAKQLKNIDK
jgi:phosphoesterase RecJ-like protein